MNIEDIIASKNEADADLALDFASFLLRYHRLLDYTEFSDDQRVISRIKRAETYRSWADIEDLAIGYESLLNAFTSHK